MRTLYTKQPFFAVEEFVFPVHAREYKQDFRFFDKLTNDIMAPGAHLSEENQRRIAQVEEATALLDRTVKERHMTELLKIIQPPYTFYTDYNRVGPPYRRAIEERLHHNDLPKGALKLLGAGADAGMALWKASYGDTDYEKGIDFTGEILTPGPSFSDGADWLINQMDEPDMSVKEASLAAQNAFFEVRPAYKYLITDAGMREHFIEALEHELTQLEKDRRYTDGDKLAMEEILRYIIEINRHADTEIPYMRERVEKQERLWWYYMEGKE